MLPFSTDQFAGAAAIEREGLGVALAPNTATADELADALRRVLDIGPLPIATALQSRPGPARAYEALNTN